MQLKQLNLELKVLIDKLTLYPEVEMIYLFGSQATGKARPYSDVDICIMLAPGTSQKKIGDILSNASKKIQLSLFDRLPLYIQYRVFKEGKKLFIKNKLEDHRLTIRTILSYLDFKNVLERHVRGVLA